MLLQKKNQNLTISILRWEIILSLRVNLGEKPNIVVKNPRIPVRLLLHVTKRIWTTIQFRFVRRPLVYDIKYFIVDLGRFSKRVIRTKNTQYLTIFSPGQSTNSAPRNFGQWSNKSMYRTRSFFFFFNFDVEFYKFLTFYLCLSQVFIANSGDRVQSHLRAILLKNVIPEYK